MINFFVKIISCFIPHKTFRRKFRNYFSNTNLVYIEDNEKLRLLKFRIKGLKIKMQGKNNTIILNKNLKFTNSIIEIKGNNNKVVIKKSVGKIHNCKFLLSSKGHNRCLSIGENFSIRSGKFYLIGTNRKITLGNNCMFSSNIKFRTSDHHKIYDLNSNKQLNMDEDIIMGDNIWCTMDVTISKGAEIQNDTVIGSGSFVNKKFAESNIIIAGSPAKIVKRNIYWKG